MAPEDMTSKEYYLDSSAHFAVHEVNIKYSFNIFVNSCLLVVGIIKR
jgi:hypothetical protein